MPTVNQEFTKHNKWKWYNSPPTSLFNGISEKGEDFSLIFGTDIGAAQAGTIVRVQHLTNAINDIVELQASDGSVWLYQHITANVRKGDVLGVADTIGTQNGLPAPSYDSNGNLLSSGTHIEVRYCPSGRWKSSVGSWNEPWINPRAIFAAIGGMSVTDTSGTPPTPPTAPTGTDTGTLVMAQEVGDVFSWLTDRANIIRLAKIAVGGALLLFGIYLYANAFIPKVLSVVKP